MPDWTVQERVAEFECNHPVTRPTQATKSNGVVCVYLQCVKCGEKTKEDKKAKYDVCQLPQFDKEKQEQERERRKAARNRVWEQWNEERKREFESKQSDQNREWWQKYSAYLNTPGWQQVRRRVLVRDNFTCQNCFQKVTDYTGIGHHISYDAYNRLGYSFAFEVICLCRSCHDDFHRRIT